MKISEILDLTSGFLRSRRIESAEIDAQALVCFARACSREKLIADLREDIAEEDKIFLREIVKKRADRIPLAYITGKKEFYGLEFLVDNNCLIPRPETEFLVDTVLKSASFLKHYKILDICSGPGTILLSLIKNIRYSSGFAIDNNIGALKKLFQNASNFGLLDRINVIQSDVLSDSLNQFFKEKDFDFIVCNPPYIPTGENIVLQQELAYEPQKALFAEEKGLIFYNKIFPQLNRLLSDNGLAVFEISAIISHRIGELLYKIKNDLRYEIINGYDGNPVCLKLFK